MSTQLELWNAPKARTRDRATSHAAAESVKPGPTEEAILVVLRMAGPCTDDELCHQLPGIYGPTLKTARSRLTKRGLVIPDGTRMSCRQREMTVWRLP